MGANVCAAGIFGTADRIAVKKGCVPNMHECNSQSCIDAEFMGLVVVG